SVHSRCGLHTRTVTVCRDRYPKASDTSSPPCLLRSLPAGAVAGWGLHPLEKRRLVTAHMESGPSVRGIRLEHDRIWSNAPSRGACCYYSGIGSLSKVRTERIARMASDNT